jgi:hypothetical protein
MKIILLLILILFILFNKYSFFGIIVKQPIGQPYTIPLKDTTGVLLPKPISEPSTEKDVNITINSYKNGVVNYTDTQNPSGYNLNEFPNGVEASFYTAGNPVTNCITSYDAQRRGMNLTDLVTNVCTTNGYYNYTTGTLPCTNSNSKVTGFKYTCNPSPPNPIQIIANGIYYIIVIDGAYNIWWANTKLSTSPNWTKTSYTGNFICKGKTDTDYFRIDTTGAIIYHQSFNATTGIINISNGNTFEYMCANNKYIIATTTSFGSKVYADITTNFPTNTSWKNFPYNNKWGFTNYTINNNGYFIGANQDLAQPNMNKLYVYKQFPTTTPTDYILTNSSTSTQVVCVNSVNTNFLVLSQTYPYYGILNSSTSTFNKIIGITLKSISLNNVGFSFYGINLDGKIIYSSGVGVTINPVIIS